MAVAKKAVQNAEKTEQRAQDLHTDIKEMLKKIQGNAGVTFRKILCLWGLFLFTFPIS